MSNHEAKTETVLFGGCEWGKKRVSDIRWQAGSVVDNANKDPIGFNDNGYSDLGAGRTFESLKSILQQIHEHLLEANPATNNLKLRIEGIATKLDSVLPQSRLVE